jgi:hypothetical protein
MKLYIVIILRRGMSKEISFEALKSSIFGAAFFFKLLKTIGNNINTSELLSADVT